MKATAADKGRTPQRQVLFISHDAGRTGAPIILLDFLKWFKTNSRVPFQVLLKRSGELESEFRSLAPVDRFRGLWDGNGPGEVLLSIPGLHGWSERRYQQRLKNKLSRDRIGLVYSNTITNGEVLQFLSTLGCPVITHVHELEYWIHRLGRKNLEQVRNCTDHYIVVSEAVKRNLVLNHDIPEEKIDIVKGFIPSSARGPEPGVGGNIRESLNIPKDAFVVGGSGAETWRKGKDLFIQTALSVRKRPTEREIHFLWVGGSGQGTELYELEHDIRHGGLSGKVHLVDQVSNPADYYAEFDVFVMTSREDPFPLVNLEAAALGKPIICFDDAGGTPEFIEEDAGFVVPYLDIEAVADKIVLFAENERLRKECGLAAARKVAEHHDIAVGAEKITRIIERYTSRW